MKIFTFFLSLCYLLTFSSSLPAQTFECISSTTFQVEVEVCDAVSEITGLHQVTVAPNPSKGQFELSFVTDHPTVVNLRLLDRLKRVVYQEEKRFNGAIQQQLQVEDLVAGIYFLVLQNENGILTRKLVIH